MQTEKNIQAITISIPNYGGNSGGYHGYYRISIYEFKGDPPTAYFKEDLGFGFWSAEQAIFEAKKQANIRKIIFVPNITMGDSVNKVFKCALGE